MRTNPELAETMHCVAEPPYVLRDARLRRAPQHEEGPLWPEEKPRPEERPQGASRRTSRAAVRKLTTSLSWWSIFAALIILAYVLSSGGTAALAQSSSPPAAAAVRVATPEEVRQRLEAEAAAVAAETPFDGFDRALTHYIRMSLPSLEPVSRADAVAHLGASPADFATSPPFVCHGDFTGDRLEDTAAIMHDRNSDELVLMAFHQVHVFVNPGPITTLGYSSYTLQKLGPLREPRRFDEVALVCREPGSFQSVDGSVTLTLAHDSIGSGYSEYYFVDGAYQSLVTGD